MSCWSANHPHGNVNFNLTFQQEFRVSLILEDTFGKDLNELKDLIRGYVLEEELCILILFLYLTRNSEFSDCVRAVFWELRSVCVVYAGTSFRETTICL